MKNYQTKAIIGTQWGDEGKGKISDYLARKADIIVRFQGGNNAGHSISFGGKKYALNHLPSGIFNSQATNVLAQGMVINPFQLVEEINILKKQKITNFKLLISDRAHVIMPYHLDLDQSYEQAKKEIDLGKQIGTTKKGIGPAYVDKFDRIGIRIGDFINLETLKSVIQANLVIKNKQLKAFGIKSYSSSKLFEQFRLVAKKLQPFIIDTGFFLDKAIRKQKKVLFEGAQGTMLCIENGSYPFVTSSSPTASSIPLGAGIRPSYINNVIGVVKAYSSRVGSGHMITELKANEKPAMLHIQKIGNEFGTVTKRPRRIGWLDIVALKYAIRISGITELVITLIDVLSNLKTIKIATSYKLNNKTIDYIPGSIFEYEKCQPQYITLKGWDENISNASSYDDLPKNAQNFIKKIEDLTSVKITMISVGPDRKQTIELK